MADDDLWETHAGWWIDGFTDGADPEYEEQILPLAADQLAGRATRARHRVRRRTDQPPAPPASAPSSWSASTRRGTRSGSPRSAVEDRCSRAAALQPCRSPTRPSTRRSPASCSSTSAMSTRRSPRWRACSSRRALLVLPQPPAAADAEQRVDRRPDPRPARAVLADRSLPDRGRDHRGGGEGRVHPVHPPAAEPLPQRARPTPASCSSGWTSRLHRPASSPARAEYEAAATIPRLLALRLRRHSP